MKLVRRLGAFLLALSIVVSTHTTAAYAEISASHVYHNHMPNFWAYYDTSKYASTPVGSPIRYTYDGQVIELKRILQQVIRIFCLAVHLCHMMIWLLITPIMPKPELTSAGHGKSRAISK